MYTMGIILNILLMAPAVTTVLRSNRELDKILSDANYESRDPPHLGRETANISVKLIIQSIREVNTKSLTFKVACGIALLWNDSRITFENGTFVYPNLALGKIWIPPIGVINSASPGVANKIVGGGLATIHANHSISYVEYKQLIKIIMSTIII